MKTALPSPSRPLRRALFTALIGIAALWAMPRSARAQLYVAQSGPLGSLQFGAGTVGEYDATTGAAINARLITGLNGPSDLALSGNALFVATFDPGTVGAFNATTGAVTNANFITGLAGPGALAASPVPEPLPWSMMAGCGAALLAIMLRKRYRPASV
jgi:hypothetical protein